MSRRNNHAATVGAGLRPAPAPSKLNSNSKVKTQHHPVCLPERVATSPSGRRTQTSEGSSALGCLPERVATSPSGRRTQTSEGSSALGCLPERVATSPSGRRTQTSEESLQPPLPKPTMSALCPARLLINDPCFLISAWYKPLPRCVGSRPFDFEPTRTTPELTFAADLSGHCS
jgi:hypothetical protein